MYISVLNCGELVDAAEKHWQELVQILVEASFGGKRCEHEVGQWFTKSESNVVLGQATSEETYKIALLVKRDAYNPDAWHSAVNQYVRKRVGVLDSLLPIDIWLLIGESVFQGHGVHIAIADRIAGMLQVKIYGWMLDSPEFGTSHFTLWVLLALNFRSALDTARTLQISKPVWDYALRPLSTPGWAGFWDQWLLLKCLFALPVATEARPDFFEGLRDLPLYLTATGAPPNGKTQISKKDLKSPKWLDQIMPRMP